MPQLIPAFLGLQVAVPARSDVGANDPEVAMTRSHLAVSLLVVLFTSATALAQSAGFDADRLSALLKSAKVSELKLAHRILKAHPDQTDKFAEAVAKRANHPEVVRIFKTILPQLSDQRLQSLLADPATQQKPLVTKEIARRSSRGENGKPNRTQADPADKTCSTADSSDKQAGTLAEFVELVGERNLRSDSTPNAQQVGAGTIVRDLGDFSAGAKRCV